MTIESNVSKNTYIGNGQTIIFPFTYKIWKYDEIKVTLEDEQGITSNIIPFSVTINKNGGGEVVLYLDDENKTPIPTGYTIALTRNMPFNQEQDFLNGGRFNAEVIEACFDMACAERQQLKENVERTIQIPPTSGTKPEELLNDIFSARNEAVEKAGVATAGAEISTAQANLSQSYAQSSNEQAVLSQEYANTARAWAESDTPPDPTDENTKSAKTWNAVVTENAETQIAEINSLAAEHKEEINQTGLEHSLQAQKWAESETNPDPNDPFSKSAKKWAEQASENVPLATYDMAGKVQIDKETMQVNPQGLLSVKESLVKNISDNTTDINTNKEDIEKINQWIVQLSVQDFDFRGNSANFIHSKILLPEYEHKSYIQMANANVKNVFDKKQFYIDPCSIRLTVDGMDRFFVNKFRRTFNPAEYLDSGTALAGGKDYYIFLVPDGTETKIIVSLNASFPDGYTADNSRKIGGFHTLCVDAGTITNNIASGYAAGDIIPNSLWSLCFRPLGETIGAVFCDTTNNWSHIYLQSGTGNNTTSVFGGTITDTRIPGAHEDDLARIGYRLPTHAEFFMLAWGCQDAVNIFGSADPVTTGGHKYTNNVRCLSTHFHEDITGVLWVWLADLAYNAGIADWVTQNTPVTGMSHYRTNQLLAGGHWDNGAYCGRGCRYAYNPRSATTANLSARGVSPCIKTESKTIGKVESITA